MAKLPGISEYFATVGAPAINFGRGLLGYQDPVGTQTMQNRITEIEAGRTKGNVGYEEYGLTPSAGRFTGGLVDLAINRPADFGLAGSIGKYDFSPQGRTGLNYDFTPDQDTASTGSAMLDFINAGGLKGVLSRMGTAKASEMPVESISNLERDFPGMSTGDIIDSMNNRQRANRFSGMGQMGPNKSNMNAPAALDMDRFAGVSNLGRNDMDVEQVEQLGSPSRFQGFKNSIGSGLGSIKDFAIDKGRMGKNLLGSAGAKALGLPGIVGSGAMALMGGMGNQFADKTLYGDTIDENGNVYSADQLNKMNAAGGGYTDPARSARRRTSRISKMRARDFNNKRISQTNLNRLVRQEKAQQAAREAATAARAMAKNPQVYRNAGITSGGFASQNTGTNENFSNKSGRGRTGYQEGGLASMFTRRR